MQLQASRLVPVGICTPILPDRAGLGAPRRFAAFARRRAPVFDRITALRRERRACSSVSEQKQARRFYVSGRVQGVGYRFFACHAAERQGTAGYVRNLRDGRVEVYAIGSRAQLEALLAELRRGPRHASVEAVSETEAELLPQFASYFSIDQD
jgi:acylphosphatase